MKKNQDNFYAPFITLLLCFTSYICIGQSIDCYEAKHTSYNTIDRNLVDNIIPIEHHTENYEIDSNTSYEEQLFVHWNNGCYVNSNYVMDTNDYCAGLDGVDMCTDLNGITTRSWTNIATFIDCDGDGYSNLDECNATPPTDPDDENDFSGTPSLLICTHNDLLFDEEVSFSDNDGSFYLENPYLKDDPVNSDYDKLNTNYFDLLPNQLYTLSFRVMSDCIEDIPTLLIGLNAYQSAQSNFQFFYHSVPNDSEWHVANFVFQTPDDTGAITKVKFSIRSVEFEYEEDKCGKVYLDDFFLGEGVSFEEIPEPNQPVEAGIVSVDEYGNVTLNNSPFFPIGIYHSNHRSNYIDYKNLGFNTMMWGGLGSDDNANAVASVYSSMYRSLNAGLHTCYDLSAYSYENNLRHGNANYHNLSQALDFLNENEEYRNNNLFFYHDNEPQSANLQNGPYFQSVLDVTNEHEIPSLIYQLNGNIGFKNLNLDKIDVLGTYVDPTGRQVVIDRDNMSNKPIVFTTLTVPPELHIRPLFYTSLAMGAKGISYFRDALNNQDLPYGPIEDVNGIDHLVDIADEIQNMMHIIRQPHWTNWNVQASSPEMGSITGDIVTLGTREYKNGGNRTAYVFVANNEEAAIENFTIDFSDLDLPDNTEVKYFSSGVLMDEKIINDELVFDLALNAGFLLEIQYALSFPEEMDCEEDQCNTIELESFESDFGDWIDGGVDCWRPSNYANTGIRSVGLRNGSGVASSLTSEIFNFNELSNVQVEFSLLPIGTDNGDELLLEYSTDGGGSYVTYQTWISGTGISNNTRYNEVIDFAPNTLNAQTLFRFRNNSDESNDRFYLDDIKVSTCFSGEGVCDIGLPCDDNNYYTENDIYYIDEDGFCICKGLFIDSDNDGFYDHEDCAPNDPEIYPGAPCDDGDICTKNEYYAINDETICNCAGGAPPMIDSNSFELGWGIWNDGGWHARRNGTDAAFANSQPICIRLRNGTSESTMTTNNLDLSGYSEVSIDFNYVSDGMENGDDFWLQYSADGGVNFSTLETWTVDTDFTNGIRVYETISVNESFTTISQFRFRCDATNSSDRVYLDDVEITGCEIPEAIGSSEEASARATLHEDINIFPNPLANSMVFNIELPFDMNAYAIKIFDINGQLQYLKELDQVSDRIIQVDMKDFIEGTYVVKVEAKDKISSKRFIVLN